MYSSERTVEAEVSRANTCMLFPGQSVVDCGAGNVLVAKWILTLLLHRW